MGLAVGLHSLSCWHTRLENSDPSIPPHCPEGSAAGSSHCIVMPTSCHSGARRVCALLEGTFTCHVPSTSILKYLPISMLKSRGEVHLKNL